MQYNKNCCTAYEELWDFQPRALNMVGHCNIHSRLPLNPVTADTKPISEVTYKPTVPYPSVCCQVGVQLQLNEDTLLVFHGIQTSVKLIYCCCHLIVVPYNICSMMNSFFSLILYLTEKTICLLYYMHDALLFLWPHCVPHREEEHGSPSHTKGITCDKIMHMQQTIIHSKSDADNGKTFWAPLLDFLQCSSFFT